jgi:ankyrin repeat protein
MVRILLREGQNINEISQFKQNTALHLAAQNAHILIVKYLVSEKAGIQIKNLEGKTAL